MALTKSKINELTQKATPVLLDNFIVADSEDDGRGKLVTVTSVLDMISAADAVKLTGDQSIGGIKTFTSSPVLPTPTAGDNSTKGATTAFVQAAVAGVTSSSIGLGSVDNTSDSAKPVSTAQAAALALKAPLASPAFTGTPTAPTAETGTNTTQIATTEFCGNYNQKWTYTYFGAGGSITGEPWKIHGFGSTGTLTVPLASSVASGVQISAIVVQSGTEVVLTRSGSDQFLTPTGLATTYTLKGNGSSIVLVRATASAWACLGAPDSLIAAALSGSLLTEGTPSGPTATGTKGMARFDADYLYVCTETNTWVRFPKDGSWT